ncbi:MAG TPA: hypothetical protein PKH54_10175 [Myxococcota bacterium]|nr:hypothetical protein [Myxococcota bacterium]HOA13740.1 hypothetical protein [Myxococcota bacterium]HOD00305.1 hypothetical protein [Myxococcota bacterium]HOH77353.1 hypothetical protein [Myxococcota bacterium]HPV04934.1 hypothetical protein [Myxococcota bacterium]
MIIHRSVCRRGRPKCHAARASRNGIGHQGGFILLLSLMLLLALTALGLITARYTASNMSFTGAQRVTSTAESIAVSGVESTLVMGAQNAGSFIAYLDVNGQAVAMSDFAPNFFDAAVDGSGSFGRETGNINTASWRSRMVYSQLSTRAPGYQVGEHCFIRYTSITDGFYQNQPNFADPDDIERNRERNALARDMATIFVGPILCP